MIFCQHGVERNYQHNTWEHLGYQKESKERFFSFKIKSGYTVACKAGKYSTNDHGSKTGNKAVHCHCSKIVNSEEFLEGSQ